MKYVQKDELRRRALAGGLNRSVADVFSIVAYWDQIPGGVVRAGLRWKWRNYSELMGETGYARMTIQRAVKCLRNMALVTTTRIFNPSRPGENVLAFRLTEKGYELLEMDPHATSGGPGTWQSNETAGLAGKKHNGSFQEHCPIKQQQITSAGCSREKEKKKEWVVPHPAPPPLSESEMVTDLNEVAKLLGLADAKSV